MKCLDFVYTDVEEISTY